MGSHTPEHPVREPNVSCLPDLNAGGDGHRPEPPSAPTNPGGSSQNTAPGQAAGGTVADADPAGAVAGQAAAGYPRPAKTKKDQAAGLMTVKAVIAYAEQLRDRGDRAIRTDPYARPYYPSTASARKQYSIALAAIQRAEAAHADDDPEHVGLSLAEQCHHAAQQAINYLAGRAARHERQVSEEEQIAEHSLKRHQRRHRDHQRDLDARRANLSLGERLDRALTEFSVIGAPGAALVGTSPKSADKGMIADHGDPGERARTVAVRAVHDVEEMLDRAKRRDMQRAA